MDGMSQAPEFHHVAVGEGYLWQPPLASAFAASAGPLPSPADEALLTALAEAVLASASTDRVHLLGPGGSAWVLVRHPTSRMRGIRGQVVRLEPLAPETPPRLGDRRYCCAVLAMLKQAPGPVLVLPWDARTAALPLGEETADLLRRCGRPLPLWACISGTSAGSQEIAAQLKQRPLAGLVVLEPPPPETPETTTLVDWLLGPDPAHPLARLAEVVRPQDDEPLKRYLDGRWGPREHALLGELADVVPGVRGTDPVAAMLRLVRGAPATLGSEPVPVHVDLRPSPQQPALHLQADHLIVALPRPQDNLAGRETTLALWQQVKPLLPVETAAQLEASLDEDFRAACRQAPLGSVGWWLGRGVTAQLLRQQLGDPDPSLARMVPPAVALELLGTLTQPIADPTAQRVLETLLLDALAQGHISLRPPTPARLEQAARVLAAPRLALLAAASGGAGERLAPAATTSPPRLRLRLCGGNPRGHRATFVLALEEAGLLVEKARP